MEAQRTADRKGRRSERRVDFPLVNLEPHPPIKLRLVWVGFAAAAAFLLHCMARKDT